MELHTVLPSTAIRRADGQLTLGGVPIPSLAATHGTPLYVCDHATLDENLAHLRGALRGWPTAAHVAYAGKAWLNTRLLRWVSAQGLGLDVVSEGELRYALHAGIPPDMIHLHGNNKPRALLRLALEVGVGRVVIDHEREVEWLESEAAALGRVQAVWMRLNPAVAGGGHAHVTTGTSTSKFGMSLEDGTAKRVAQRLLASAHLEWRGVHFHLGS